jgi:3D (Asp-Asp-Asp) domain-containing protein
MYGLPICCRFCFARKRCPEACIDEEGACCRKYVSRHTLKTFLAHIALLVLVAGAVAVGLLLPLPPLPTWSNGAEEYPDSPHGSPVSAEVDELRAEISQLKADNVFFRRRHIKTTAKLTDAEERATYYKEIADDATGIAVWWEYVGEVSVSWYAANEPGMSTRTASGNKAIEGQTVALGKSYPFGTEVYIEGIGYRVCHDRGGAITDGHADVFVSDPDNIPSVGRYDAGMWVRHTGLGPTEEE